MAFSHMKVTGNLRPASQLNCGFTVKIIYAVVDPAMHCARSLPSHLGEVGTIIIMIIGVFITKVNRLSASNRKAVVG